MSSLDTSKKYSLVSLFSGIGGLDAGLHACGFQPIFCAEIDPHASATLRKWLTNKQIHCDVESDVTQVAPVALMKNLGLLPGDLDLLVGGPPCQSFSLIGKRDSLIDKRGLLLFQMVKYARSFAPKIILIEQVKGLLSAPCLDNKKGGVLKGLLAELEEMGYFVNYNILRASDFGVAQLRDRLFIVASKHNKFVFPAPIYYPRDKFKDSRGTISGDIYKPYRTVYDAIADLPKPTFKGEKEIISNHIDITPARDRVRIHGVPEGQCLARQFHLPAEQRQKLDPRKDTTKFRRLSWNEPSLTLRGGEVFYHPSDDRYLTPRECLRLHSFSDNHVLVGPIRGRSGTVKDLDQHRMVANAVPPSLSRVLGECIVRQLLINKPYTEKEPALEIHYCC